MKSYRHLVVACLAGLAFFAPLKFSTPVIAQAALVPPDTFYEWVYFAWPNQLATLLAFAGLVWLVLDGERLAARVDFLFVLPLIFLAAQAVAAPPSISPQTTADTVMAFAVDVLLFYAAAWYVRDGAAAGRIFGALGLATFLMVIFALQQHFGGLQQTRNYAAIYADNMSSDMQLRLTSNRVFGTLANPNTLAGFLVVAFAPTLAWIWARGRTWVAWIKWATMIFLGALMAFCLALTGSRGGTMAFAAMLMAGLFCFAPKGSRRTRWVVIALLAVAGGFVAAQRAGFIGVNLESFFARRDYWKGAMAIARDFPWLGTGPGTFGSIYPKYKTAMTEETRLVHNNFLQMWSDSGISGFLAFALLWLVALRDSFELARQRRGDVAAIAICAALAGWVVHSLVDFDLYVPGVAIPAFLLLGVLQGLKDLPAVEPVKPRGPARLALAAVCVVVVGSVWWMEGRSLAASFAHAEMYDRLRSDLPNAMIAARRAVELAPHNATYQAAAGDLAVARNNFTEAIEYYRAAIDCDPYRPSYHWRFARTLAAAGGPRDQVIEQLEFAHQLNPTKQLYRDDLAAAKESVRQSAPLLLESAPAKKE